MASRANPFTLRTPCTPCPFRSDKQFPLRPGRAKEFADDLRQGGSFMCHKTVTFAEDDEGETDQVHTAKTKWCAGALITMEREGFSNQQVRIAERIGLYDAERLKMDAPVYDSLSDWVRSYRETPTVTDPDSGEEIEFEHCGVVADDCEDPAGFAYGGGAVDNDDEPTCNPLTDCCSWCGNVFCSACRGSDDPDGGHPRCVYCAERDDED